MLRHLLLVISVVGLVAGCSGTTTPPPASQTTTTATSEAVDQEAVVECANLERAYRAWEWTPETSLDWSAQQVQLRLDDGDDFLTAVKGYTDQPALALATAIAEYNLQLSLVAADYQIEGAADTSDAMTALDAVKTAYRAVETQTCS